RLALVEVPADGIQSWTAHQQLFAIPREAEPGVAGCARQLPLLLAAGRLPQQRGVAATAGQQLPVGGKGQSTDTRADFRAPDDLPVRRIPDEDRFLAPRGDPLAVRREHHRSDSPRVALP